MGVGPLRHQVVDVAAPVLDRRVADLRAGQRDHLDDGGVERVGRVDRGGAALDVVNLRALVRDDQRPLELAGVLAVDAEVRLERERDLHALRDVDEAAARPDRAVERRELVVLRRDHGAEVLLDDLRVLAQALVHAHEDHADLAELLADGVVDDLRVVLGADAGEELALRLGDAQLLERLLDLVGHVVPGLLLALGRLAVVDDLAEVEVLDALGDPGRHRAGHEVVIGAESELEHPVRLGLEAADLDDRLPGQADLRLRQVRDVVVEAVLVVLGDDLSARDSHRDSSGWGIDPPSGAREGQVGNSAAGTRRIARVPRSVAAEFRPALSDMRAPASNGNRQLGGSARLRQPKRLSGATWACRRRRRTCRGILRRVDRPPRA